MQNLWTPDDQMLLELINKYIVSGPTLERPDQYQMFCTKTDFSKDRMVAVLLKAGDSVETINSESQ